METIRHDDDDDDDDVDDDDDDYDDDDNDDAPTCRAPNHKSDQVITTRWTPRYRGSTNRIPSKETYCIFSIRRRASNKRRVQTPGPQGQILDKRHRHFLFEVPESIWALVFSFK